MNRIKFSTTTITRLISNTLLPFVLESFFKGNVLESWVLYYFLSYTFAKKKVEIYIYGDMDPTCVAHRLERRP